MRVSIPSKHFILGEYLALSGGPSLLMASGPRFLIQKAPESPRPSEGRVRRVSVHSESPAGKLLGAAVVVELEDGLLGGGQSTAEFLWAWNELQASRMSDFNVQSLWRSYRDLFAFEASALGRTPPSGFDLVAQAVGGFSWIRADLGGPLVRSEESLQLESSSVWPFPGLDMLLFKTPQKLKTHEHLQSPPQNFFSKELRQLLSPPCDRAFAAWKRGDGEDFSSAVEEFGKGLQTLGLVHSKTREYLQALQMKGVRSAKGCGALGADVLMLLVDRSQIPVQLVVHCAERLDLVFLGTQAQQSEGARIL